MDCSNLLFAMTSCACVSIAFLAGIFSQSATSNFLLRSFWCVLYKGQCVDRIILWYVMKNGILLQNFETNIYYITLTQENDHNLKNNFLFLWAESHRWRVALDWIICGREVKQFTSLPAFI